MLAILWPLVGIALIGYGAYTVYAPAGYITVGILIVLDDLHSSWPRRTEKPN